MKICSNCGIQLSCGCQRREASDGTQCCDQCVGAYEAKISPQPSPSPSAKVVVTKKVSTNDTNITNDE